jgi:hypothetical protein
MTEQSTVDRNNLKLDGWNTSKPFEQIFYY